jgi:phosphoribosyl-ATP pyrophosphohydrolase/phosphoribosyl-AMP cyclohydrolase
MVLLRERGVSLDEVMAELGKRHNKPTTNKMNR